MARKNIIRGVVSEDDATTMRVATDAHDFALNVADYEKRGAPSMTAGPPENLDWTATDKHKIVWMVPTHCLLTYWPEIAAMARQAQIKFLADAHMQNRRGGGALRGGGRSLRCKRHSCAIVELKTARTGREAVCRRCLSCDGRAAAAAAGCFRACMSVSSARLHACARWRMRACVHPNVRPCTPLIRVACACPCGTFDSTSTHFCIPSCCPLGA